MAEEKKNSLMRNNTSNIRNIKTTTTSGRPRRARS